MVIEKLSSGRWLVAYSSPQEIYTCWSCTGCAYLQFGKCSIYAECKGKEYSGRPPLYNKIELRDLWERMKDAGLE